MAYWLEESVFGDGASFYHRLLLGLDAVTMSLDLEVYIFNLDDFGRQIAQKLLALAAKGVRVRVLVDGVGSLEFLDDLKNFFHNTKVELKVYGPVWSSGWGRFFRNLNRRNHRKVWLLDRRVAFVGGMNIAQEYVAATNPSSSPESAAAWKDYGVRVVGEGIGALEDSFARAWRDRVLGFRKPLGFDGINKNSRSSQGVILNDTYTKRRENFSDLLALIDGAQHRVWLANAYLAPHPALVKHLLRAGRRGVDVRILVSEKSDVFFMPWLASVYFKGLLRAGVKIYEYLPAVFHGKVRLLDNHGTVGSTNLNYRSLLHDLEVDIKLEHVQTIYELGSSLENDFLASRTVTLDSLKALSWYKQLIASLVFRLRYWL